MKLYTLFTASIVALTGFDNIASAKSFCAKKMRPTWAWRWEIHIDEVEDVAETCDRLWKAIDVQKHCVVDVPRWCGKSNYYENPNALHMWFKTTQICDDGKVASAFGNATENNYGTTACEQKEEDWMFKPEGAMIDFA